MNLGYLDSHDLNFSNRLVRTRMPGGVAGARLTAVPYADQKPSHMTRVSPKGTVPVLCLSEVEVIDESLQIMHWALRQNDPLQWLDGLANDTGLSVPYEPACSWADFAWATSMSRGTVTPFLTASTSAITLTAISAGVLLPM